MPTDHEFCNIMPIGHGCTDIICNINIFTPYPFSTLSHILNISKWSRRDETCIWNLGHQKEQHTSDHENKENVGPEGIPVILSHRLPLVMYILLYMLCDLFEFIPVQIVSIDNRQVKQRWICIDQSQKCRSLWCLTVLHEPYLRKQDIM